MVASVNFRYFLQIKIMRERESRRQRCLLMKHIILRRRQKQKLFITLCSALISLCRKQKVKRNRRVRRFEQNCGWFQKVWNAYDNKPFKSCFRISRETFNFILNRIGHHLTHDTTAEEPISPQERLGICLYRLSRGDYYHTIAEMTGRGLTTVQCITQEVCKVIVSNLWSEFVNFPETVDQMLTAILQMEDKWQFPSAFGGVDGCHIPMKCPSGGNEARRSIIILKFFILSL